MKKIKLQLEVEGEVSDDMELSLESVESGCVSLFCSNPYHASSRKGIDIFGVSIKSVNLTQESFSSLVDLSNLRAVSDVESKIENLQNYLNQIKLN